jgi:membrane-associated phospholipid phosphatase
MTLTELDTQLFLAVNAFARATPWLWPEVTGYATYGIALFAALLLAGYWFARRYPANGVMPAALWAPVGVLVAVAVNQPLADALDQPRPYARLPGILVLAQHSPDPALPSDHAVMAGAVVAGLFLVQRCLGWCATVAAAFMAFARVYIAAHFPLDVLAGLLLGAAVSLLGHRLLRTAFAHLVGLLATTHLRPLVAPTRSPAGRADQPPVPTYPPPGLETQRGTPTS